MKKFYCGLDLGQSADYTALAIAERITTDDKPTYQIRHLELQRAQSREHFPGIAYARRAEEDPSETDEVEGYEDADCFNPPLLARSPL